MIHTTHRQISKTQKKPYLNDYILHVLTFGKWQLQGQTTNCQGLVLKRRLNYKKGSMKRFFGVVFVLYYDCGDYTILCICQNSQKYTPVTSSVTLVRFLNLSIYIYISFSSTGLHMVIIFTSCT